RKVFWSSALAVSMLAGTAAAQSGDDWMNGFDSGAWYIGGKLGGNFMAQDTGLSKNTPGGPIRGVATFDDGFIGAFQAGYGFNNGLSLEFEFGYRYNDTGSITPYGKAR